MFEFMYVPWSLFVLFERKNLIYHGYLLHFSGLNLLVLNAEAYQDLPNPIQSNHADNNHIFWVRQSSYDQSNHSLTNLFTCI